MRIRYDTLQGIGARDSQQDSYGVEQPSGDLLLAIVADGMGGLVNSGAISQTVADTLLEAYAPNETMPQSQQLLLLLRQALLAVQSSLAATAYESGTTLVFCIASTKGLSWVSVGDSRICLWRNGGLIQLNRDHDFARDLAIMTLNDSYTFEEIAANPRRDALTSYIGKDTPKYVDYNAQPIALQKGDRIILMTDGVYRSLSEQELVKLLKKPPHKACRKIQKAISKKGFSQQDNYTAIIMQI